MDRALFVDGLGQAELQCSTRANATPPRLVDA